jgi:hypothetical protein
MCYILAGIYEELPPNPPKTGGERVSTGVNMKTGSLCKTRKHDVKENVNRM